jgi:hypothetical protein
MNMIKYLSGIFFLLFFTLNSISQVRSPRQTAVEGRDVVADAPWRMKKTDALGNLNGIPVHIFIKDGDAFECNADLIYLNIYIKNSTDTSFGAPIIFNTYTNSAFASLFSSKSLTDAALDIQDFDASLPVKDPNYTIQFTSDYSWTDFTNYVNVNHQFWYFTFTIPPEKLAGFNDLIDIEVYFSLDWETDDIQYLRVFRNNNSLPKLTDWYRGDTHYHSMYTNNYAEFGLPLDATKQIAKAVGMDYMITTNHSCDYDNYGTSMQANWNRETGEIQALNAADTSMIFIHGMEASVNNSAGQTVHMLSYPNSSSPYSIPYLGDGNGDLTATAITIDDLLDSLKKYGGFSYAAHPFAGGDKLSSLINGSVWNVNDPDFLANGASISGHDVVICNDPSSPSDLYSSNSSQKLFKDGLKGGEIWNYRNAMETTDQKWNPWNDTYDNGITAFAPYDSTTSTYYHYNRFLQGLEVAKFFNVKGLKLKNSNNNLQNYRFFMSAGSDAHGDFNYSNTNFVYGFTSDISDAALGKPSTLVYCPSGRGAAGGNVLSSLENGHVIFSDGPLVSIGISTDGNNNTLEYIIGQEAIPSSTDYLNAKLRVDLASTSEFGNFKTIKFILGTQIGEHVVLLPVDSSSFNRSYIYNLDSLIKKSLAGDSIKDNEYFYIRAELSTYKNYNMVSSVYKRSCEIFHGFTNPIWMKKPSSITTFIQSETGTDICHVYPNPFGNSIRIHLDNINASNFNVSLYNAVGSLIQSKDIGTVTIGGDYFLNTTNLPEGVYLLKVSTENRTFNFKLFKTSIGNTQ